MTQVLEAPVLQAPVLEARNLTKHFPIRASRPSRRGGAQQSPRGAVVHAVDDANLVVAPGSITAIVGESGSGKSTLARMLARLIKPTSGELLLDGQRAAGLGRARREYARAVQLVLQDPFSSLNPIHDVRYHLARPLKVHKLAGRSGSLDESIESLLDRVSLSPPGVFASKLPHELSGGQRQRVAIARALAVQPRLLLADEPVSMLDVSIRLGVLNLLADLREKDGVAIVYVTHDIASARYLADDVVVMYAGRIVESGPASVITERPAHPYTELLLSAAPNPERRETVSLRGKGSSPSLVNPPSGCRFHPRCPHAMRLCASEAPAITPISPGHGSACWLHVSGLDQQQRAPLSGRPGKQ